MTISALAEKKKLTRKLRLMSHKVNLLVALRMMNEGAIVKKFNFSNRKTDIKWFALDMECKR